MSDTLQAISQSLRSDVQTLTTISHNVANISTPGYRSMRATPGFPETGPDIWIEQRDGGLIQTQRSLDLALRGPGFFVVERDGQALLTRAGTFRVDAEGWLVTTQGARVLGGSGPISLPQGDVHVDAQGQVRVGNVSLDQLQIVAVADSGALRPEGDALYRYDGALGQWNGSVVQGAIEGANVDPAAETVRLMETTRHAEAVQRAISIYDKALDAGINRLGEN